MMEAGRFPLKSLCSSSSGDHASFQRSRFSHSPNSQTALHIFYLNTSITRALITPHTWTHGEIHTAPPPYTDYLLVTQQREARQGHRWKENLPGAFSSLYLAALVSFITPSMLRVFLSELSVLHNCPDVPIKPQVSADPAQTL